jgi:predicted ATPase/DNA-binding SARP family transcriptional activator
MVTFAPEVRLLGRPAVLVDGAWMEPPPGKSTALLLYLAFHGGWVGRDELVYVFWPDVPEAQARGNLRPLLSRLHALPYAGGVERDRSRVRWPVRTDLHDFRAAVEAHRWREAWERGGELLAGFTTAPTMEFEQWLDGERVELRRVLHAAGVHTAHELTSAGDDAAAATVWASLHRMDPLDEVTVRSLLVALARSGARSDALAAFERFRDRLVDEVGGEPEGATLAVVEAVRSGAEAPIAHQAPPATSGGATIATPMPLPIQPTRFVGRVRERAAVRGLLAKRNCRLLTIIGPGGTGKTRLAVEVASEPGDRFSDGARFVDLVSATTEEAMAASIVRALGGTPSAHGDPGDDVLRLLEDRSLLLVLDNLEHLVGYAGLIATVLAGTPGLSVLATSRRRLGLQGEHLFELGGLSLDVPSEHDAGPGSSDAATLFVRAARRLRPELVFGRAEGRVVDEICSSAEGLPLALELAAGWLRALSIDEVLDEVRHGPPMVDGGARDRGSRLAEVWDAGPASPVAHSGMRSVFERSWSLLSDDEQRALRSLAAFRGGWTREAAAVVADVGMQLLLALIDASLVRREPSGRFGWHPLVQQYAAARAEERPEERDEIARRHAEYYLGFVGQRKEVFWRREAGPMPSHAEVEAELANVCSAWWWAVAEGMSTVLADAINGLAMTCFRTSRSRLLGELAHDALSVAEPGSLLHGRALLTLGRVIGRKPIAVQYDFDDADPRGVALLEEGLAVVQALAADRDVAAAWRSLGAATLRAGRKVDATRAFRRAEELYRALGDAEGVAAALTELAQIATTYDDSLDTIRAAVDVATDGDEPYVLAWAYACLGLILFNRVGPSDEAYDAIARGIELHAGLGSPHYANQIRLRQALMLVAGGRLDEAVGALETSMQGAAELRSDEMAHDIDVGRSIMAWAAYWRGDATDALRWSNATLAGASPEAVAPEAERRARTVLAKLALDGGDVAAAAEELRHVRSLLPAHRLEPDTYDPMVSVVELIRPLTLQADFATAEADFDAAEEAVREALTAARRAAQVPAGMLALAAAARLLDARGDRASAIDVAAYVAGHPGSLLEAQRAVATLSPSGRVAAHFDGPSLEPLGTPDDAEAVAGMIDQVASKLSVD